MDIELRYESHEESSFVEGHSSERGYKSEIKGFVISGMLLKSAHIFLLLLIKM